MERPQSLLAGIVRLRECDPIDRVGGHLSIRKTVDFVRVPSITRQIDHARAYAAAKGWTVADWQGLLTGQDTQDGRELLRQALDGPIRFTPDNRRYQFTGEVAMGGLLSGIVGVSTFVASPRGHEEGRQWQPATFVVGRAA
jgi:hypothetical protein